MIFSFFCIFMLKKNGNFVAIFGIIAIDWTKLTNIILVLVNIFDAIIIKYFKVSFIHGGSEENPH